LLWHKTDEPLTHVQKKKKRQRQKGRKKKKETMSGDASNARGLPPGVKPLDVVVDYVSRLMMGHAAASSSCDSGAPSRREDAPVSPPPPSETAAAASDGGTSDGRTEPTANAPTSVRDSADETHGCTANDAGDDDDHGEECGDDDDDANTYMTLARLVALAEALPPRTHVPGVGRARLVRLHFYLDTTPAGRWAPTQRDETLHEFDLCRGVPVGEMARGRLPDLSRCNAINFSGDSVRAGVLARCLRPLVPACGSAGVCIDGSAVCTDGLFVLDRDPTVRFACTTLNPACRPVATANADTDGSGQRRGTGTGAIARAPSPSLCSALDKASDLIDDVTSDPADVLAMMRREIDPSSIDGRLCVLRAGTRLVTLEALARAVGPHAAAILRDGLFGAVGDSAEGGQRIVMGETAVPYAVLVATAARAPNDLPSLMDQYRAFLPRPFVPFCW
jgi:hypothetical protein